MSIHSHFDNPASVNCLATAPIVLRFASMFPRDLKRRDMHDKRTGGDLSHIRLDLSHFNSQPVGEPDWIEHLHAEIAAARDHNFEEEIAARERKGRFLEAERLRERGAVDPWKFTREGPLREGIITVNKLWFGGTGHESWEPERMEAFKQRAVDFLLEHFPDRQLKEVNIDEDEEALHLHFVVAVWVEKVSLNRGRQWLLQPSANPLLANYEHAQDLAGEAFLDLGIHRGEWRAAAARQARAAGLEAPAPRRHVQPSDWRREQRRLALEDRDRIREATRAEAEATVADGLALAKAVVKKSRKRSIKEAKARRAETDRQVAAAERDRDRADAQAKAVRAAQAEAEVVRVEAKRQAEEARAQAARITQTAEGRARVIVSDAKLVGAKALQKARKRAVRETQSLRDEVQRMKADTAIELRRGQLAAAYVRGRTFQLQERARNLSRDIAVRAKIWADRERQHRQQELRLAQIEKERVAAEAAITQAQDTAARVLAAAEARAEEAQRVQEKVDADRNEVDQLSMAAQGEAVRITQAAEDRAGVIVADAIALATVTVRKSRKRAVADARARRANAERVAAAIEQEREATEARAELARQALARAHAERGAAENATVVAWGDAAQVRQAAEAEADLIRITAAAVAETEQARADAARCIRDEAEAARLAANQAAAEVIGKAKAERAEAARATARAEVITAGLAALTQEMTAGTLSIKENGHVIAQAPDLLRPAFPEIGPAVRAAATVAEETRAARQKANDVARTTDAARRKAAEEIARDRAAVDIEFENTRKGLDLMEKELKGQLSVVSALFSRLQPLLVRVVRWLSHPELPASVKEEGVDLAAEAFSVLDALRQKDDPVP
ncbi:MAG: hypothetical protein IKD58_04135 [Loktanella sp.]|nr:hypothetical protein [Loktanella sp.]